MKEFRIFYTYMSMNKQYTIWELGRKPAARLAVATLQSAYPNLLIELERCSRKGTDIVGKRRSDGESVLRACVSRIYEEDD